LLLRSSLVKRKFSMDSSLVKCVLNYVSKMVHRRPSENEEDDNSNDTGRIIPSSASKAVLSPLPQMLAVMLDSPPVSREVAKEHSWNTNDRSLNVVLKEDDPLTMRRHPVAQSTDCIRGKTGYSSGIHLWSVSWPLRQRGTHAVVGVATREAVLHSVGYQSLVGNTEHSWGWDLGRKKAYHNSSGDDGINYPSTSIGTKQSINVYERQWTVPDTFNMVLDMDSGKLGFVVGDQFLGWSHCDIKSGTVVFPIVNTVWGHCEVKLRYLGGLQRGEVGLQALAKTAIRNALGRSNAEEELSRQVETLGLPRLLRNYLKNSDADPEASTLNNNNMKSLLQNLQSIYY
jgi:SPRY domain-containing SOCS box protein 1/4